MSRVECSLAQDENTIKQGTEESTNKYETTDASAKHAATLVEQFCVSISLASSLSNSPFVVRVLKEGMLSADKTANSAKCTDLTSAGISGGNHASRAQLQYLHRP